MTTTPPAENTNDAAADAPENDDAAKAVSGLLGLFRKLVDKVPWFSESDHAEAHAAIDSVQKVVAGVVPGVDEPAAPGPAPEPQPQPEQPTPAEAAATQDAVVQEGTGGQSTAQAASEQSADPTPPAEPDPTMPAGPESEAAGSTTPPDPTASGTPATESIPPEVAAWLAAHPELRVVTPPATT